MDYRIGTCSQCGAEFKVPASFRHNVARCKVCQGVVRFDGQGVPQSTPEAPAPKPVPARKVAPSASTPVPEDPPKKKGGTLERLRAERQAQAEAQAKPDSSPARPKAKASTSPARTRASAAKQEEEESSGSKKYSSGRSRRGSGSSSRRGSREKKKKSPAPLLAGVGLLVVAGGGAFFFKDSLFGGADAEEVQAQTAPTEEPLEPAESEEPIVDEGMQDPAEAPPEEEVAPEEEPEPFKAPTVDPSSVDLSTLPDFGPVDETTDEEWASMTEWMTTWMNPNAGAAGNRAKNKLVNLDRKAWPVILNHMKTLDFSTEDGKSNGDLIQRTLSEMVNGNNFDWRYTTEPKDELFNKKVVQAWHTQWERAQDNIGYWINFAKLEEKDPERAKELREKFGEGEGAGSEIEDPLGDLDDLDVD